MSCHAHTKFCQPHPSRQAGASLLEVVVATTIVTIGLLGAAAAIGHAFRLNTMGRYATTAKLAGVSMLEQLENLRNTRRLTFKQLANAGQVDNSGAATPFAGFATGLQVVSSNPGADGIYGTADDLVDPGPDTVYGTGDDFANSAWVQNGYWRQVTITSLNPTLKRVTVVVRYPGSAGNMVELTCIGYLNDAYNGG